MRYRFAFKGGVEQIIEEDRGEEHKFLMFLFNARRETSFFSAKNAEMVKYAGTHRSVNVRTNEMEIRDLYETDCATAKIFVYQKLSGMHPFFYSFFFQFGSTGRRATIQPLSPKARSRFRWEFHAEGRFLKPSELKDVMDTSEATYRYALTQGTPSKDVLRQMVSVVDFGAAVRRSMEAASVCGGIRKIRKGDD